MITKRVLVDLLVAKISGGSLNTDVRGVAHPRAVETQIGLTLDDLVADNPTMAESMAYPYEVTISDTAPFVGQITVPLMTPKGIYLAYSEDSNYSITTPYSYSTMSRFNPSLSLIKIEGSNVTLNKKPTGSKITILAIPNFRDMAYDHPVILLQNQTKLFDLVLQRIMAVGAQEKENDSRRDIMMSAKNRR